MARTHSQRFWMVWRENGGTPTHKHFSKVAAIREADRLAAANPGGVFFVLKATTARQADAPQVRAVEITDYNCDIPF